MTRRRMALDAALALSVLGAYALTVGLAYLAGWAIARAIEVARVLRVPQVAPLRHKRHALVLSRPKAGRTTVSSAGQVSRTGHHSPALEATTPAPRSTLRAIVLTQAPGTASCPRGDWAANGILVFEVAVALLAAHVDAEHGGRL